MTMREVYGQPECDDSKVITHMRVAVNGKPITDCLGHVNGVMVNNADDLDTVVAWLAESTRPHGFAISETRLIVFIRNTSGRLYSDWFVTSSFRPEIYTTLGYNWVNDSGPNKMIETVVVNGHIGDPVPPRTRSKNRKRLVGAEGNRSFDCAGITGLSTDGYWSRKRHQLSSSQLPAYGDP